jgi:hypothetical protein
VIIDDRDALLQVGSTLMTCLYGVFGNHRLAMAFKLIESAQDRWRAVNAPHLVALVRAGATFVNGKLIERPGEDAPPAAA